MLLSGGLQCGMTMHSFACFALLVHAAIFGLSASAQHGIKTTTITRTVALRTLTTTLAATGAPTHQIAAALQQSSSMPSGRGDYTGSELQSAVLNSTNYYRKIFQAQPLSWNGQLARYAHKHAQTCVFQHSVICPPN